MQTEKNVPHCEASISPIVESIERLFYMFNEEFFNSALSKPVITLSQKGTRSSKGWCTKEQVWKQETGDHVLGRYYEINICPEYLNRPVEEICETLLHEMVHLFDITNGTQDCSSNGQYHNKSFKESAEKHGLNVEKSSRYGYSMTSLDAKTLEFIRRLDLSAFDLYREEAKKVTAPSEYGTNKESANRPSSTRTYVCPQCNTRIRATKCVQVRCETCNKLFEELGKTPKHGLHFSPIRHKREELKKEVTEEL